MRKLVKRCEQGIICRELQEPYLKLFSALCDVKEVHRQALESDEGYNTALKDGYVEFCFSVMRAELKNLYSEMRGTCFICSRCNRYITEFTAEAEVYVARQDLASAETQYANIKKSFTPREEEDNCSQ